MSRAYKKVKRIAASFYSDFMTVPQRHRQPEECISSYNYPGYHFIFLLHHLRSEWVDPRYIKSVTSSNGSEMIEISIFTASSIYHFLERYVSCGKENNMQTGLNEQKSVKTLSKHTLLLLAMFISNKMVLSATRFFFRIFFVGFNTHTIIISDHFRPFPHFIKTK